MLVAPPIFPNAAIFSPNRMSKDDSQVRFAPLLILIVTSGSGKYNAAARSQTGPCPSPRNVSTLLPPLSMDPCTSRRITPTSPSARNATQDEGEGRFFGYKLTYGCMRMHTLSTTMTFEKHKT
ncbi:hypothetical protein Tcan_05842 [Toxocara canis]|uniref:Uncharacterized protein n=1 Tax=Toxocara canis TaxID=6265 RepID=A0A0B2VVF0_TOXCA|nr:hypothetical protein Tcan_05842 [Toxocara canis]